MRACRCHDFQLLLLLCLVLIGSTTVWADEAERMIPPDRVAAIATDAPAIPVPAPQDVAREVLRLQEEMGGSITEGFGELPPWVPSQPFTPKLSQRHFNKAVQSPIHISIHALRETAWQLEQSAYLLESLDLYDQADAVRETAAKLRDDARKLKGNESTAQAK